MERLMYSMMSASDAMFDDAAGLTGDGGTVTSDDVLTFGVFAIGFGGSAEGD